MRRQEDFLQVMPEFHSFRRVLSQFRHHLLDLVLRCRAERQAVPRHESECAERQLRVAKGFGPVQKNSPIDDREFRIRKPRAQILKLPVKRWTRGGKLLEQLRRYAMDQPRMLEVNAHPVRGGEYSIAANANLLLCRLILCIPGESIVVAGMPKMKEAARGHQKIQRISK